MFAFDLVGFQMWLISGLFFFGFALLVRVLVDLGLTGVVVLVCV